MATRKATKKAKGGSRAKKLSRAKKMKEVKPLLNSFSFGASNPAN
jgi:hypothetical protein